jgi:hypothetical protein
MVVKLCEIVLGLFVLIYFLSTLPAAEPGFLALRERIGSRSVLQTPRRGLRCCQMICDTCDTG